MLLEEIIERKNKAEEAVAKVEKTIERHKARLLKLEAKVSKQRAKNRDEYYELKKSDAIYDRSDESWNEYWEICKVEDCVEAIENNEKKLEEKKQIVKNWENKEAEARKSERMIDELPEILKELQKELVDRWNKFDIENRERVKKEYEEAQRSKTLGKFYKEHKYDWRKVIARSDADIDKENKATAKAYILDLINRVKAKVGNIEKWDCIRANGVALNGWVVGEEGRAEVRTVLAGGYNIQRLHTRTLVL